VHHSVHREGLAGTRLSVGETGDFGALEGGVDERTHGQVVDLDGRRPTSSLEVSSWKAKSKLKMLSSMNLVRSTFCLTNPTATCIRSRSRCPHSSLRPYRFRPCQSPSSTAVVCGWRPGSSAAPYLNIQYHIVWLSLLTLPKQAQSKLCPVRVPFRGDVLDAPLEEDINGGQLEASFPLRVDADVDGM
jgi:hypothetical protein